MQTKTRSMESTDAVRERSIRLYNFLQALVQLRSKSVRQIENYEETLWLADVPETIGCYSIFRAHIDEQVETDTWLEIIKPEIEPAPAPPAQLQSWLKPSQLSNPALDAPELLKRIPNPALKNMANRYDAPEFLYLDEQREEILPVWKTYVNKTWQPWARRNRTGKQVEKIYNDLYSIYQRQQKLGESYEVVLGLGCLVWRTPGDDAIKRHVLTATANIAFDTQRGAISIGPSGEGRGLQLEQDMLDIADRPDPRDQSRVEASLAELDEKVTDIEQIGNILEDWLLSLRSEGKYQPSLKVDVEAGNFPQIVLAPALLLRKRTDQSMLHIFNEIVEQLSNGGDIPASVANLVEIPETMEQDEISFPANDYDPLVDGEIFFPLPANEEQRHIITALNRQKGVVVQGPPGTGKSHTIANVVSHLLAKGQRVLVTSHTTRALRVLENMLPPSLAALAIVALDDDAASVAKLEASATGIIEQYNHWDPLRSRKRIKALRAKLGEARRTEARILRDMRAIRESETYEYLLEGGDYNGTQEEIAGKIREQAHLYEWFLDRPEKEGPPPLTDDEAVEMVKLLRKVGPEEEKILRYKVIASEALLPVHKFARALESTKIANQQLDRFGEIRSSEKYPGFSQQPDHIRQRFLDLIDKILDTYNSLDHHAYGWVKKACSEILAGRVSSWQTLLGLTEKHLEFLKTNIGNINDTRISGLSGRDLLTVKEHANRLYNHLIQQGTIGLGPFRPRVVRDSLYLIKSVTIDGAPCDSVDSLRTLLDYIEIADKLEVLSNHWSQHTELPKKAPFSIQVAEFESLFEPLQRVLELHEFALELREIINENPGVFEPNWHDIESIRYAKKVIIANETESVIQSAEKPFIELEQKINEIAFDDQAHPVMERLLNAVRERNLDQYQAALREIAMLGKLRELYKRRNVALNKLVNRTPKLLKNILLSYHESSWDERLQHFSDAWHWACAESWLRRVREKRNQEYLALEYETIEEQIRDLITKLSVEQAWDHCFSQMSELERQHLLAWTKAIQRLGKGTGKYAAQHRQNAREHMEACKTAIPAWIMPVYRVAETVNPAPGIFDVAIIDEASQSGPEALFLMYIAKKIIVVGDNNQISPDFIGINREDIDVLREQYLSDIPHNDLIGLDNSFFDQAEVRFGNPIRLREHFRSMPEIIEFSNQLCYQTEPLIPLRQFHQNLLTPAIVAEFIANGSTKGSGSKIVNPEEADGIVSVIKNCCEDPRYDDKTFGVISLQGTAQARLIEKKLLKVLGAETMEKRNIVCGDAYAFQGDERDVMFLSMVVAPGRRIGPLANPKDKRRFNVAVSRARDQVWLFHSIKLNELSENDLRHSLLEYFKSPAPKLQYFEINDVSKLRILAGAPERSEGLPPAPFDSWFEVDIFLKLKEKGYRVVPKYTVDSYTIDLVIEGQDNRLGIECYGASWKNSEEFEENMMRQRMLRNCGWDFQGIYSSEYYRYPEKIFEGLLAKLTEMDIKPISHENGTVKNGAVEPISLLTELN